MHRLRHHSRDDRGFTLIELLVVILIIGILVVIAISSLLSQKSKAYDASAKTLVQSARTTAEAISTDNGGRYDKVTLAEINAYEKSIPVSLATANGGAYLSVATEESKGEGFVVTATAPTTGDLFTIKKEANGQVVRTCKEEDAGDRGCPTGTW